MTAETRYAACNLCEAICGLEITVAEGRVLDIRGDAADPLSRGHICPKALALQDVHDDPDRLRQPVRRTADGWEEISWEAALDLVVNRLIGVRRRHGRNAVGVYLGNPSVHNYGIMTHGLPFLKLLGTRNRFSATSVDQLPHQLVAHWMYGHQLLLPIPDIDRTSYFLVLGANPIASNGSLMTVPDFRNRLKALQARGGKMVVFDPRRTETARVADEHHFIRPGTDVVLLLALLNTVLVEGRTGLVEGTARTHRLSSITVGIEEVRTAIIGFTPERAATVTGVPAEVIRGIARQLAEADTAAVYGRMGLSTQRFGALCQWAIQLLNLVTGNLDRPGGTMFTRPAVDIVGSGVVGPGHFDKWRSRVRGLPEFAGELPVAALAEEILTPGDGQIRAMVTVAGNPVLSTPHGEQVDRAFASLDFHVAVDYYINETTRHADVILPPTAALEHDHYDLVFHALAVRNTARYSPAVLERPAGALHDWEIFAELARRYRRHVRGRGVVRDLSQRLMFALRPDQIIALGLLTGPYRMRLRTLKRNPHGVDLGALRPALPHALRTPDKKIHCAPSHLLADLARVSLADTESALLLIGRRHLRSNNSWLHNSARLVKGKPRHHLLMHPADLKERGLTSGDMVRIRSRVGMVEVPVEETEDIMRGVVSLPHGFGHGRTGVRLRVASEHAGVSINDLTDDTHLDDVSGNAALNGLPVTVEPS